MGLRLLLIRHAQTVWNRDRRYQGWQDSPLSVVGRAQAEAVGRALAQEPLKAVYASTLGRALVDGARNVRIFGERVAVQARIVTLGGFSAHAGQSELLEWVTPMILSGARVALVHGEEQKRSALATKLAERSPAAVWRPARRDVMRLRKRGEPVMFEDRSTRKLASRS